MKVTVKEKETFKPITIEFVIESEQELCDLWHRMNVADNNIKRDTDLTRLKHGVIDDGSIRIFNILDNKLISLNLKK